MKKCALFLLAVTTLLVGCTTKTDLSYHPVIEKQTPNDKAVLVNAIEDIRPDVRVIGAKKNGFKMPFIKIVTDDNVSEWVTNALKTEMGNAGYSVVDSAQDAQYQVQGKLLKAFASSYLIYDGKIRVKINVRQGDSVLIDKVYHARESAGVNWFARSKTCAKTLEMGLQEVSKQFIFDLNQALLK